MENSDNMIKFKQVLIQVNAQVEKEIENLELDANFKEFKDQLSQLLNKDINQYSIHFQSSEEEKQDNIQPITVQEEYYSYINKAHIQDYGTLQIFLDSNIPKDSPFQESHKNQILDSCFVGQQIHESFEVAPIENSKLLSNEIQLLMNLSNECSANQKYDASEAIIETSEMSLINPSLQLSHLQSKQKSSELDINPQTGQPIKKQSISNLNLPTMKSEQKLQSNEALISSTSNSETENIEILQNMINYEIIRQILNKFPKLQPENIEDDLKIKQHISYFQSQNAANRRSTSPQPKQKKPNDLSQSMILPNYKCNVCKASIEGVRFHCLVCQDTDHCETCQREKRGDHNHPFMKYKNVQSSKLNKSQRIFPPSQMGGGGGAGTFYDQNSTAATFNTTTPFQLVNKNTTSTYFNQPLPSTSPQQNIKNYLASSNANLQGNNGLLHFQNISQRPNASPLAQTMPSAPKQQQQQQQQQQQIQSPYPQQNVFFNNNLQQSQNLNIPINHFRDQQNPLNDMFTNQVISQTYFASTIPQQKLQPYVQNNVQNSSSSSNSGSFGQSEIKVQKLSDNNKPIIVEKGETFKVIFTLKNGGKFQFPEGGIIRGADNLYQHVRKSVLPLKQNEYQDIELELKAPNINISQFYHFKVEFPTNPEFTAYKPIGPRFDFQLVTK